jgi:acetyl esterase/lipase
VPVGFLITCGLVAAGMTAALWPPSRSGPLGMATWIVSAIPNESPFLVFWWLGASTLLAFSQGNLHGAPVSVALGLAIVSLAGTPGLVRRSLRAVHAIERVFDRPIAAKPPWARVVLTPLPVFHPGVRRIGNLSYGDHGRRNRLDLYRRRGGGGGAPVLIHLHGGGFSFLPGRRSFYARRLLFRLARQGWVCISATYRLQPSVSFPDELIEFGARLATLAGFTANDPAFQPGFEGEETSVAAVVGLYGYYGGIESRESLPSSPFDYVERGSAPLMIVHGDQDTFTPAGRACELAEQARSASENVVVYVELPGAQHSFDLLCSIRFEAVIDGIEAFAIQK